ncbi:hypothetical protein C8R43DRAFT_1121134 [Mycena crocata]|nr:hypothetical protein C8R43DRAFT_1121134 [Mycena crocata]
MLQLAASLLLIITPAFAQTLYELAQAEGSTRFVEAAIETISAIGIGADGWTTYRGVNAVTFAAIMGPSVTSTIIDSTPVSFTETFQAAASGLRANGSGFRGDRFLKTCAFGKDGHGTCIEKLFYESTPYLQATFSGSFVPLYTLPCSTDGGNYSHCTHCLGPLSNSYKWRNSEASSNYVLVDPRDCDRCHCFQPPV